MITQPTHLPAYNALVMPRGAALLISLLVVATLSACSVTDPEPSSESGHAHKASAIEPSSSPSVAYPHSGGSGYAPNISKMRQARSYPHSGGSGYAPNISKMRQQGAR